MLSRSHLGTLLNYGLRSSVKTNCLLRNLAASASNDGKTSLNVETTFIQPDVQRILKKITGFDPEIVFPKKPVPVLRAPRYLFMSNEELRVARERAAQRGRKLLEMVPYMLAAEDNPQILEDVPELQGYETANLVFTDISGGANDRNRLIVVREPSGILRRASREERHRMNQTFFPFEERYHEVPKMFGEKQLERVLNRGDYVFALERAVAQFEPDDAEYIRVSHQVYAHVLENKSFDSLWSTRHYGSMAFHFCVHHTIDEMLADMIRKTRINDAKSLVDVYFIIHNETALEYRKISDDLESIKFFMKNSSRKRHILELAVQSFEDSRNDGKAEPKQESAQSG